jgi:hypothetical protein
MQRLTECLRLALARHRLYAAVMITPRPCAKKAQFLHDRQQHVSYPSIPLVTHRPPLLL